MSASDNRPEAVSEPPSATVDVQLELVTTDAKTPPADFVRLAGGVLLFGIPGRVRTRALPTASTCRR